MVKKQKRLNQNDFAKKLAKLHDELDGMMQNNDAMLGWVIMDDYPVEQALYLLESAKIILAVATDLINSSKG